MTIVNPPQRRFWVVSPNVRDDYHTVGLWRQASVLHKAAFMGYPPGDKSHKEIGYKFAHVIRPNDIVLIARSHHRQPQVVGYGVVVGPYKKTLSGLKPPESFGCLRKLAPFNALSGPPPKKLNLMAALRQIAALHELHPRTRPAHRKICDWMERQLKTQKRVGRAGVGVGRRKQPVNVKLANLPHYDELEFQVRTKKAVLFGKQREAILLAEYRDWLLKQGRKLQIAKYKSLRCDAYDKKRNNLIEAKCSAAREYVRMGVGQLFEYSYLGRELLSSPNKAILLPERPDPRSIEWLADLKISVVWKEKKVFLDNANGQFS
jgi:hypothetical protein